MSESVPEQESWEEGQARLFNQAIDKKRTGLPLSPEEEDALKVARKEAAREVIELMEEGERQDAEAAVFYQEAFGDFGKRRDELPDSAEQADLPPRDDPPA